jgi:hypothetical protein
MIARVLGDGNTADVTTLVPMIDRRRRRHRAGVRGRERGMMSAETMAELEAGRLLYILRMRERSDRWVRELVLDEAPSCRCRWTSAARRSARGEDGDAGGTTLHNLSQR